MQHIASLQNPKVKRLIALSHKPKERTEAGLFVLEGWRELAHCLEAGLQVEALYVCPEIAEPAHSLASLSGISAEVATLAPAVYAKVAYRGSTEGIIALVRSKPLTLADISPGPLPPLYLVLEGIEKPGNLGAVLRSADASAATAVIACDLPGDLYNPNVVRSSLGSVFTVPCVTCSNEDCLAFLRRHGVAVVTAQLQDSVPYYGVDLRRPVAIVLGNEARGLTPFWREASDARVHIPMLGRLDSLNVSVSAAILLFEAVRQRG